VFRDLKHLIDIRPVNHRMYIRKENLWADFEESLAHLNDATGVTAGL
jgi:hypothetical protein